MMKDILLKNWVKLPIAIYVVGFLVHNFYLSVFNIYDFEIIQARYIYTGFICIIFVASVYLFAFMRLNFNDFNRNLSPINLYLWAYRISLFSVVFYSMLFATNGYVQADIPPLAGLSEKSFQTVTLILPVTLFMTTFIGGAERETTGKYVYTTLKIVTIVLSPIVITYCIFLSYHLESYRDFYAFFIYSWAFAVMLIAGLVDAKNGLRTLYLSHETSEDDQRKFSSVVAAIGLVLVTLMMLNLYSKYIYPLISTSWGGGKPIDATITANNKEYAGDMLSESAQWTYIRTVDNAIYKIKSTNIREIKLIVGKKSSKRHDS